MSNDNASLLILGWFIFAIIYSGVINRVRNIDVTPIGRVFAAFVGILMWAPIYDADKFNISLIFYAIFPVLILLEARHPVELVFKRRETRCQLSVNTWLQILDLYTHLKTITEIFQITSFWFKEISYRDRRGYF